MFKGQYEGRDRLKKPGWQIILLMALSVIIIVVIIYYITPMEGWHLMTKQEDNDTGDQQAFAADYIKLRSCPTDIEEVAPSRVVIQMIDNQFYRWKEYELDDPRVFCIVLEEPEQRRLTAAEARELLEASGKWVETSIDPEEGYILKPTDPRVDMPPVPMPSIDERCP